MPLYRVIVRQNVVREIRRIEGEDPPADDPLAVSTLLARNNRANGCLDGDYDLPDAEAARHFAALSLGFLKNLCERAMERIADADTESGWQNPFTPDQHTIDRD